MSRKFGTKQKKSQKKTRSYEGMTNGSITSARLSPASLYTHIKDMRPGSPTLGQRIER